MIGANEPAPTYTMPINAGADDMAADDIGGAAAWRFDRLSKEFSHFIRTFKDADNQFPYK